MNNIVRALVIALTLTGGVATLHSSNASAQVNPPKKGTMMPTPMCPPNDPNACGIADRN